MIHVNVWWTADSDLIALAKRKRRSGLIAEPTNVAAARASASAEQWNHCGRYIAFLAVGAGLSVIRSDGSGKPQPLTQIKNRQLPQSFAPDGKRLVVFETASGSENGQWTVPLESDNVGLRAGKPEVLLQTRTTVDVALSSDGRRMAYASNESGTKQVYVRAFPDEGRQMADLAPDGERMATLMPVETEE